MLAPQGPTNNENEEELTGAATALSLLSPPTDNLNSQHLYQSHMKCYYNHTHNHCLYYFNDPILDDAVICTGDLPFLYNKIQDRYTKFIGNPLGTVFVAVKRDHEFLISKGRNKHTKSSD